MQKARSSIGRIVEESWESEVGSQESGGRREEGGESERTCSV